jgi:VWFA-related protein
MKRIWTICLAGLIANAQSTPPVAQAPLVLKSTTRLVQVSVIVTKKGEPFAGLKKEDFTVLDNGKPQQVGLFSMESSGKLPAAPKPLPPNTYTNRLEQKASSPSGITIILLDSLNSRFEDRAYTRNQIVKYLKTIQPEDRIGLYTLGRGIRVLHDYTADSSELLAKLAKYKGENLPDLAAGEPSGMGSDALQLDSWLNGRGGASGAEADFYTVNRVQGTLRALQFIADHLARVPGRKNLIWLSGGFPLTLGFDNIGEFMDPRREHRTFSDEITQCVRAMNNANLAIYPVDARGLMVDPRFSAANRTIDLKTPQPPPGRKEQDSMEELASRTGGRAYFNTNDLAKAIHDSVADTRLTYTLGYYPSDDKFDGKFHSIKIKVDQPGISLRYRKGYFDLPEQPQNEAARKVELRNASFSPLDATEIGLVAQWRPTDPAKPGFLSLVMQIEPRGISLEHQNDRWAGKLDILFVQKDEHGKQYNGQDDTLELRLTEPNYRKAITDGLIYQRQVPRAPRGKEMRVIVRDAASGAVGSLTMPFPDAAKH